PTNAALRRLVEWLGGPFRYRLLDREAIIAIPHLEQIEVCAGGMATLATFRAPAQSTEAGDS
ncbi:MAG: hypothetical protein PVF69_13200, partial [Gemmatimonadota bacterium]